MSSQIERPQYYEGEYLGAADLEASVTYAHDVAARHALGAHLWGIAIGLDLVERPLASGDVEIAMSPGIAYDGYGRSLVALAPQLLTPDLFVNVPDTADATGAPVQVWLNYSELPAQPPGPGFSCADGGLFGRVVESVRFELRTAQVIDSHAVTIANRSLDAASARTFFDPASAKLWDESVPQQDLPESGTPPRWPIFVGVVRWVKLAGQNGRIIARTDADRQATRAGRRYLGAVAETISAPDGLLRLRDRSKDPNDPVVNCQPPAVAPAGTVNDLVWCEGNLRVVGDARLQAGKLDYRIAGGGDGGVPIVLQRTTVNAPIPQTTLDAHIGPAGGRVAGVTPETRFTVSTNDATGKSQECLTVVTDGRVGINAAAPSNSLQVEGDTGIRYKDAYISGDQTPAAVFAYNAYTSPAGPWVFPTVGQKAAAVALDNAAGIPEVKIQTNQNTTPASPWVTHVVVRGDTGNVGIGTVAPAAKLHVTSPAPGQGQGSLEFFSATADIEYDGGQDGIFLIKDTGGKTAFMGGDIGIGTAGPQYKLDVVGDIHASGDVYSSAGLLTPSDERMKKGIADIEQPLARLLSLRGVSFEWKEPEKHANRTGRYMGLIAQEAEQVFPEWVKVTPSGEKALGAIGFEGLVVEAMRELTERCRRLEEDVASLRSGSGEPAGVAPHVKPRSHHGKSTPEKAS
jgi:hypothetical protein